MFGQLVVYRFNDGGTKCGQRAGSRVREAEKNGNCKAPTPWGILVPVVTTT